MKALFLVLIFIGFSASAVFAQQGNPMMNGYFLNISSNTRILFLQ